MKKLLAMILTVSILLCAAPIASFSAIDWSKIDFSSMYPFAKAATKGDGTYTWPVTTNHTITAGNYYSDGSYHGATDFGCSIGTPVYATAVGTVITAADRGCQGSHRSGGSPVCPLGANCKAVTLSGSSTGSHGNFIIIDHGNNVYSMYAHLKTGGFSVNVGDTVSQGQQIALSGGAGNSTGPHLHFELRMGSNSSSSRVDPQNYLTKIKPEPTPPTAPTFSEPPTKPIVSLDKTIALIDSDVTINFSSERANSYWIGVYNEDVLFSQSRVYGNTYTINYSWVGKYDIVIVAENNCGSATGYASFRVGHEGDYAPENFTVSCNKAVAQNNSDVTFSFNADNADSYWIGVYTSGGYLYDQARIQDNTYTTQCPWEGNYNVVIVAENECSSSTEYIQFSVVETLPPPTVPSISVNKKVGLVNENIVISFSANGADDYWIGIYKENELWEDAVTDGNTYTSYFSYVGEYKIVVVARNESGSTASYSSFKIGREGDYVPDQFTVSVDKTIASKNELVKISFSASNADCYWLGVSKDGNWVTRENVYGNTFSVSYSETGEYRVAIVAMNECSSSVGKYLSFTVVEKKEFSIQYNANGGYNEPSSQIKLYGKNCMLSNQCPKRPEYRFVGWNTSRDGSGVNYNPGATYILNNDLTLYAIWNVCSHDWDKGVILFPATCVAEGERSYTCKICDAIKNESISILPTHTWGEPSITKQSNCTEIGIMTYTCTVCSETKEEPIEKTPHHDDDSDGTCDDCGAVIDAAAEEPNCVCGQRHTGPLSKLIIFFHKLLDVFRHLFNSES